MVGIFLCDRCYSRSLGKISYPHGIDRSWSVPQREPSDPQIGQIKYTFIVKNAPDLHYWRPSAFNEKKPFNRLPKNPLALDSRLGQLARLPSLPWIYLETTRLVGVEDKWHLEG